MKTCKGCEHMKLFKVGNMAMSPACMAHEEPIIVPHMAQAHDDHDGFEITFWRIPVSCPRDDVEKGKDKAPVDDWEVIHAKFDEVGEYEA